MVTALPTIDDVDPKVLASDPYPVWERLRREAPIAWVPTVRKVLITSFSGCVFGEQHPEVFSSNVSNAAMTRAVGGRPMLRKDDPEHAIERSAVNPTLRPRQIKEVWGQTFAANAEAAIDVLEEVGREDADLNRDLARPLAAKNLADLIGFRDVDVETFARWSADFIAGAGNVLDDAAIWERCERSRAEADAVVDELLPYLERHPDSSMASLLLASGMNDQSIRANIYLTISGGVNEPQHMITNIVLLLSQHPESRPAEDAEEQWSQVFNEAVRMYTPIGMVTRETVADVTVDGVEFAAGSQVGLILASANRDAAAFNDPDSFRVGRAEQRHLGFGSGAHMCAGKWVAEASVGTIAMPALYRRLPELTQDTQRETTWNGWAFRGMTALPVTW